MEQTAAPAPTPGGGSVSAVTAALGAGLVDMAVAVTAESSLDSFSMHLGALRKRIAEAADLDVAAFRELLAAYRLPRDDPDRRSAVEATGVRAAEVPLDLLITTLEAIDVSRRVEPLVKPRVVSDVLAGRDLLVGAARAAIRTADINIDELRKAGSSQAIGLAERRDALIRDLEAQAPLRPERGPLGDLSMPQATSPASRSGPLERLADHGQRPADDRR
ncbi:MAG: cyclodeaminase/cyclohydrolase family protein [Quadrisphaera sp.]